MIQESKWTVVNGQAHDTHIVCVQHAGEKVNHPFSKHQEFVKLQGVLSILPKIPEISVGIQMERFVSVSSDRNIRDHLWRWSTYFGIGNPGSLCVTRDITQVNYQSEE